MYCSAPFFLLVIVRLYVNACYAVSSDVAALVVVSGSGMCKVCFSGDYAPRTVFPSVVAWPKMLDIMAGMDQTEEQLRGTILSCQTVLRTLVILQLQFVARWSMSSSCWYCRFHRFSSWRRWLTCPLCATSGAGRDCARNCGGLRSCSPSSSWSDVYGGFGRILHIFYVIVNSGPEVDCRSGNLVSTSPLFLAVTPCAYVSNAGFWKIFIYST